jgi:hypothetical protein
MMNLKSDDTIIIVGIVFKVSYFFLYLMGVISHNIMLLNGRVNSTQLHLW